MGASCVRWTGDTELAFLLALRMTGQVTQAAARIGRAPGVCYDRRRRVPAFAAAWAEALHAIEAERLADAPARAAGEQPPRLTRTRRDGWTQQRQRAFCRALADTGSYGQAAAQVGLSREAVRRFRVRSPDFQAQCDRALAEGGTSLEDAAYTRAVEGWAEPVFHGGKLVGHRRRYSDALLRALLQREAVAAAEHRPKPWERPTKTLEEIQAEILRRLRAVTLSEEGAQEAGEMPDRGDSRPI